MLESDGFQALCSYECNQFRPLHTKFLLFSLVNLPPHVDSASAPACVVLDANLAPPHHTSTHASHTTARHIHGIPRLEERQRRAGELEDFMVSKYTGPLDALVLLHCPPIHPSHCGGWSTPPVTPCRLHCAIPFMLTCV